MYNVLRRSRSLLRMALTKTCKAARQKERPQTPEVKASAGIVEGHCRVPLRYVFVTCRRHGARTLARPTQRVRDARSTCQCTLSGSIMPAGRQGGALKCNMQASSSNEDGQTDPVDARVLQADQVGPEHDFRRPVALRSASSSSSLRVEEKPNDSTHSHRKRLRAHTANQVGPQTRHVRGTNEQPVPPFPDWTMN